MVVSEVGFEEVIYFRKCFEDGMKNPKISSDGGVVAPNESLKTLLICLYVPSTLLLHLEDRTTPSP